ncbi:MAG: 50S ribosomal protein L15 [bacterium]
MLNSLPKITKRNPKRVGRGYGSGKGGHTVGRGQKGQKSRSAHRRKLGFEGGQLPLYKRLPQIRGWGNKPVTEDFGINLALINEHFKTGEKVTPKALVEKGLVTRKVLRNPRLRVKILGSGKLEKVLKFEDVSFSANAKKKIEAKVEAKPKEGPKAKK